jgi:hypothetical protein
MDDIFIAMETDEGFPTRLVYFNGTIDGWQTPSGSPLRYVDEWESITDLSDIYRDIDDGYIFILNTVNEWVILGYNLSKHNIYFIKSSNMNLIAAAIGFYEIVPLSMMRSANEKDMKHLDDIFYSMKKRSIDLIDLNDLASTMPGAWHLDPQLRFDIMDSYNYMIKTGIIEDRI